MSEVSSSVPNNNNPHSQQDPSLCTNLKIRTNDGVPPIKIRDFAYPQSDPRHFGKYNTSSNFKLAKALYDFIPENSNELAFSKNDVLVIKYKQDQGWLVGFLENEGVDKEDGLIPESYIEYMN